MAKHDSYHRAHLAFVAAQRRFQEMVGQHGNERDDTGRFTHPAVGAVADLVTEAGAALAAATGPLRSDVDAVWQEHLEAVQAATEAVREALQAQAAVEVEAGNAARARSRDYPVLTAAEIARVTEARQVTGTARAELAAVGERFKAGVTAEQLEGR